MRTLGHEALRNALSDRVQFGRTEPRGFVPYLSRYEKPTPSEPDGWNPMDKAPTCAGPYLLKIKYEHQSVLRYRVKELRPNVLIPQTDIIVPVFYTKGDLKPGTKVLGWMPIAGHNYHKTE